MAQYIDKSALIAEINNWIKDERRKYTLSKVQFSLSDRIESLENLLSFINTLEVKEVDLTDAKTDWSPSKKQMESLKDMLRYNIGVFDYQKFMEVNSLYDDLTKILDYETDRQK